ncbi:uncharacterized protein LOC114541726 [Dendronephthya gigantea]|uniref:uncharacterized protein LOC114541726 n=1 Tax=Dendronephthya gigantea TaxID=151771 RepID=UPI00106D74C3|nr:uncharacterized protein LOC114541726 [Dendronephthya gigantea]
MEAATVVETFLGFIPAKQGGTAKALTDTVLDYLRRIGITSPAPFVHCASHNLNLVVNDAVECNADSINFFADLEEIYAFFNRSINRTADLNSTDLSVIDEFTNEVSFDSDTDSDDTAINKLCATRWSSRINSVRAVKNRYRDLLHVLDNLKRKGKDNVKEREEAASLHLKLNKFEFVVMLIIWEKLLAAIQIASANLQSNKIDLSRSAKELERAMRKISGMRDKWDAIKMEAVKFALKVGVSCTFAFKRVRRVPRFYDEFASDSRPQDPEERFTVEMFYQVIDTATNQLEERFRSQKFLADTFKFVLPGSLATLDITEVRKSAELFVNEYKGDICTDGVEVADYISDLVNEIKSFRWCYGDVLKGMSTVSEVLCLLKDVGLSTYSKLLLAVVIFITLPVTIASAERSFSKWKLIKNYLRSSIAQDRLDSLAILSIENNEAWLLDIEKLIDTFADKKARIGKFVV